MSTSPPDPNLTPDGRPAGDTSAAVNTPPPSDPGIHSGASALDRFMNESDFPPDFVAEQKSVLLQPGHVLANRFEVREMLGFGGMGTVYRVTDWRLQEDKALKIMLPSLVSSEAARQRFLAEIKISQRLSHELIVRVHDFGEDPQNGVQFFTMEFVEGKTLHKHVLERGGRLDLDEAIGIFRQLCAALGYAHAQTIHRDLKPQNVMLQPSGSIKVLDFGLAKLMSPGRMAKSSMALGTAYYQAPEQSVRKGEVDQRADIYSLGVILYELLVGELPVGRFAPPSEKIPRVPRKLDDVIMKCLSPQPEDRYASVPELLAALDAAMTPSKLVANPRRLGIVGAVVLGVIVLALAATMLRPGAESTVPPTTGTPAVKQPAAPPDTALQDARDAAISAQKDTFDAWSAVPADANDHAAQLLEEATAIKERGDETFNEAEQSNDPEAYNRATSAYNDASAKFAQVIRLADAARAEAAATVMTAEQARAARQAAADAREAALEVGATVESLQLADEFFAKGDALLETDPTSAAQRFGEAQTQFTQAGAAAMQAKAGAAQSLRQEADAARQAAVDAQATPDELQAGLDALARGGDAVNAGSFDDAATAFAAARDAFSEAGAIAAARVLAARVETLKSETGLARQSALDAKATNEELDSGANALAAAEAAEQQENLEAAATQYAAARDTFRQAAQAANARAAAMRADLAGQLAAARDDATAARDALTPELREHAPKESQTADTAWDNAVKADTANDLEAAMKEYGQAKTRYDDAVASAKKNMDAAQSRLATAQKNAESSRGKISAETRVVAPADVEAGDTSFAAAEAAVKAGDVDLARKQFEDADSSYRKATQALAKKNEAMQADQQKAEQAKAAEEAAKANEHKARDAVARAKSDADSARTAADTATVKEFAGAEFDNASAAYGDAQKAEQSKKYDQAASFYATAKTGFANAATLAAERQAQQAEQAAMQAVRDEMNTAKSAAQTERSTAATAATREHAATELQQAEQTYTNAESQERAGNLESATTLYNQAKTAFTNARSTAQTRMQQEAEQPPSDSGERVPLYKKKLGVSR